MEIERKFVGHKQFRNAIDITDPCYDRDVWCRMNNVQLTPGIYECAVDVADCGEWGKRIASIMIFLKDSGEYDESISKMKLIGSIGVDAGLAGFFDNKPDYNDEEWGAFCESLNWGKDDYWIRIDGFFSSSGFGDGGYDVYAASEENGLPYAFRIVFIEEDEEE